MMKNDCDIIQLERSVQSCASASNNAELINNTTSKSVIRISTDAIRFKRCFKSIHTNNEKSATSNQRIVESKMCDLLGQFITFTSRSRSPENNSPNYTIPSTSRLDCQFRQIELLELRKAKKKNYCKNAL
jgi:hypothetical protein